MVPSETAVTHCLICPDQINTLYFCPGSFLQALSSFTELSLAHQPMSLSWFTGIQKDREVKKFLMAWNDNHLFAPNSTGQNFRQGPAGMVSFLPCVVLTELTCVLQVGWGWLVLPGLRHVTGLGLSVKGLSLPPNAQIITQFLFALHLLMDSWPNKVIEWILESLRDGNTLGEVSHQRNKLDHVCSQQKTRSCIFSKSCYVLGYDCNKPSQRSCD